MVDPKCSSKCSSDAQRGEGAQSGVNYYLTRSHAVEQACSELLSYSHTKIFSLRRNQPLER